MAAPLLRVTPILRLRLPRQISPVGFFAFAFASFAKPSFSTDTSFSKPQHENATTRSPETTTTTTAPLISRETTKLFPNLQDREAEILRDIQPITLLVKEIIHSDRYEDGEHLSDEDEKAVVEKLLSYHPHSEDKIGSGLDSIMVDRHPEFKQSRCLFVVRTNGDWIDFSYQKCLRAYIRQKYPDIAERFIRKHYKRT